MESELEGPACVTVLDLDPRERVLGTWAGQNSLAVVNVSDRKEGPRRPSGHQFPQSTAVQQVQWASCLWNDVTRRLVNQSHGFFMDLREGGGGRTDDQKKLIRCSRFYRCALRECVGSLSDMASDQTLPPAKMKEHSEQAEMYSMMELVWGLCEPLFLEVLPHGCLVQQLMEWVNWNKGEATTALVREVASCSLQPEQHNKFWPLVYRLVLQGRMKPAVDLLSTHSFAQTSPKVIASMSELLKKVPMVRSTGSHSRMELQRCWYDWRAECTRRLNAGEYVSLPQLHLLCCLLRGDEEAFCDSRVIEACETWYELMVGRILFTTPLVVSGDYDLQLIAESCVELYGGNRGSLEQILLAALKSDMLGLIKLCSSLISNWWFIAHLTDLLHLGGMLVVSQMEYGARLSEFLLQEYACSLLADQSLWEVAMDYFNHCPTRGRNYMSLCMERVPLVSYQDAIKALSLCYRLQLKEEAQGIYRVLAMRACRRNQLSVALQWCLRAKDAAFAGYIAERYFESYEHTGELKDLDLLDGLDSTLVLSDKLTFLGKYREFHVLYGKREFGAAGQLLVSLLNSKIVPKRFWVTLLTDALPLLELKEEVVFDVEQTHALAHSLEEVIDALPAKKGLPQSTREEVQESAGCGGDKSEESIHLSLLRLALVRNLSRALMAPPGPAPC